MSAPTLDRVLTEAGTLPLGDREILEELLRRRRIGEWRGDTAAEARKAGKAFRSGKLKGQSAEEIIARLRTLKPFENYAAHNQIPLAIPTKESTLRRVANIVEPTIRPRRGG